MFRTVQLLLFFILAYSIGSSQYIKFNAFDSIDGFELEIDSIEFKNLNNDIEKTFYSDSIIIPKVSSVEASSYESEVRVYPNPAEDELNIKFSSNLTYQSDVKIFDLNGRKVYTKEIEVVKGENTLEIDLSGLSIGPYFLKVDNTLRHIIKNTEADGITLINNANENKISSDIAYEFIIFAENYREKVVYTEEITEDTTIDVLLAPSSSSLFKNKYLKIEFFLKDAVFKYYYITNSGGDHEETIYDTIDYEVKFIDTLYFRGNDYYSKYFQDSLRDDCLFDCFEERTISFNVDTVNQYIENLTIKYYKHLEYETGEWYKEDEIKEEIALHDPIQFGSFNNISISYSLDKVDLDYLKRTYNYESILSSHYKYYTFEEILDLENSYIKIEFTDIP